MTDRGDGTEAGEGVEVKGQNVHSVRGGHINDPALAACCRSLIHVEGGLPHRLFQVDRVEHGIRKEEKLIAPRLCNDGRMAGRVAGRRHQSDSRHDFRLTVYDAQAIVNGPPPPAGGGRFAAPRRLRMIGNCYAPMNPSGYYRLPVVAGRPLDGIVFIEDTTPATSCIR